MFMISVVLQKMPLEVKLHNIAKELLTTEVTYVDRLHLIDQVCNVLLNQSRIPQWNLKYTIPTI